MDAAISSPMVAIRHEGKRWRWRLRQGNNMRISFRSLIVFLVLQCSVVLIGCARKAEPPKDLVVSAMTAIVPSEFKVVDADVDYNRTGERMGEARVKLVVSPTEDLYESTTQDKKVYEVGQADNAVNKLSEALERAKREDIEAPSDLIREVNNTVAERNRLIAQADATKWIAVSTKKDTKFTVYGRVAAAYEFKEWRFSHAHLDQNIGISGKPRSAFPPDAMQPNSAEADELAQKLIAADKQCNDAIRRATNEMSKREQTKKAADAKGLADRKDVLVRGSLPGTKYVGFYQAGSGIPSRPGVSGQLLLEFQAYDPDTETVEARVSVGGPHPASRTFVGKLVLGDDKNKEDAVVMKSASPVDGTKTFSGFFDGYGTQFTVTFGEHYTARCKGSVDVTLKKAQK